MAKKMVEQPIPLTTFAKMVQAWAKVVKAGESALVYHYTRTDLWWRLKQLEDNKAVWESVVGAGRWPLVLDVVAVPLEDGEDVQKWLNDMSWERPLFVFGGERLIREKLTSIWAVLVREARIGRSVLVFSNVDLNSPAVTEIISSFYELAQNVLVTPLYTREDAAQFVNYLAQKWVISIPGTITKQVLEACEGHIGLVKQLLRVWRDEGKLPEDLEQNGTLETKLSIIWGMFDKDQHSLLRDIVLGKQLSADEIDKASVREFLVQTRWLKPKGKSWQLTVPILNDWLVRKYLSRAEIKVNIDHLITFKDVVIEKQFSRQERKVLRLLLAKPGEVITREQIAEAVWESNWEEKYSDWAIDQIISRLRKKLNGISGGGSRLIRSIRNQGYIYVA